MDYIMDYIILQLSLCQITPILHNILHEIYHKLLHGLAAWRPMEVPSRATSEAVWVNAGSSVTTRALTVSAWHWQSNGNVTQWLFPNEPSPGPGPGLNHES